VALINIVGILQSLADFTNQIQIALFLLIKLFLVEVSTISLLSDGQRFETGKE
tara:strand:- start:1059 stop:1217 length:159 start_codon:yes stop_codon:yes gene_type:complete